MAILQGDVGYMRAFLFVLSVLVMMPFVASAQVDFKSGKGVPYIENGFNMAVGDFDGNGQQDVVFAADPDKIIVYYSIGPELIQKTFNVSATKIAVGDFNGDAKDDLMIIDLPLNRSAKLKKCISTGTSFDTTDISTLEQGSWSFEIYDHDEDGNLDLLLMKKFDFLKFYKGDGAGNFQQTEDSALPYASDGAQIVCADFNSDNKPDILIKGFVTVRLYVKNSENQYDFSGEFDSGGEDTFVETIKPAVADFDGDGNPDVVVVSTDGSTSHVLFYANNGGGVFAAPVELFQNSLLTQIDHHDYDNDGNEDLVLSRSDSEDPLFVLHNLGSASFEQGAPTGSAFLDDIAFVNTDGSDEPEIVGLSSQKKISIFKFNGSAYEFSDEFIFGSSVNHGNMADLDNDGFDDIVVSSYNGAVTIWYGKADGEFEDPVIYKLFGQANAVAAADFNGDGYADIAVSAKSPAMNKTFVMFSVAAREYRVDEVESGESYWAFATGDFNNDGNVDFTAAEKVWLNNGDETFTSSFTVANGYFTYANKIDTGHFNDDEFLDLAVAGDGGDLILYNDGAGVFTTFEDIVPSGSITELHTADLNNDGLDDFVTFNATSGVDVILFTRIAGAGFDETHVQSDEPMTVNSVSTADMDGDGLLDIVIDYSWVDESGAHGGLGIFRGKIEGGYESLLMYDERTNLNNIPGGVLIGLQDIDRDSRNDVVILSQEGSPATVVLQQSITEPTVAPTISAVGGSASATITIGPGNGSGRLLIVRKESAGSATAPDDNSIYTLNTATGDVYVHMTSTENTLSISDLEPNASYVATVFEYNSNFSKTIVNYLPTGATTVFSTRKYQQITITPTNPRPLENASYTIQASSSAGLPLTYNLISGNGTLTDNIYTPAGAGSIHVEVVAEGNAEYESTSVEFTQCIFPVTPVISMSDDPIPVLTSSSDANNIWERNGAVISNATDKTYTPVQDGVYRVIVSVDGCQSFSEFTPFIVTAVEDAVKGISLSPNPATNAVVISNYFGDAVIYNALGTSFKLPSTTLNDGIQLNTSDLTPGLYIVRVGNAAMRFVKQ